MKKLQKAFFCLYLCDALRKYTAIAVIFCRKSALVVQWIEWKIPVLQIRVRFPTSVQSVEIHTFLFLAFFFLSEQINTAVHIQYSESIDDGKCFAAVGVSVHYS